MTDESDSDLSFRSAHDDWPDSDTEPGSSPNPRVERLRARIHAAYQRLNTDEPDTTGWRKHLKEQILDDMDEIRTLTENQEAIKRQGSDEWILPSSGGPSSRKNQSRCPKTGRYVSRRGRRS